MGAGGEKRRHVRRVRHDISNDVGGRPPMLVRMHWIVMFRRMSTGRLSDCCFNLRHAIWNEHCLFRPMLCCMRCRPLLVCFGEKNSTAP